MLQTPVIDGINQWLQSLTLPGILATAVSVTWWLSRKQRVIEDSFGEAMRAITNIRDNHLHHIQESLDGIKTAQVELGKQHAEGVKDTVAAINASKDAIVAAIIASRN